MRTLIAYICLILWVLIAPVLLLITTLILPFEYIHLNFKKVLKFR